MEGRVWIEVLRDINKAKAFGKVLNRKGDKEEIILNVQKILDSGCIQVVFEVVFLVFSKFSEILKEISKRASKYLMMNTYP